LSSGKAFLRKNFRKKGLPFSKYNSKLAHDKKLSLLSVFVTQSLIKTQNIFCKQLSARDFVAILNKEVVKILERSIGKIILNAVALKDSVAKRRIYF
jgi:hypothetical protein